MFKSNSFGSILFHVFFLLILSNFIEISKSADTLSFISKGGAPATGSSMYFHKASNKVYAFGGSSDGNNQIANIQSVSVTSSNLVSLSYANENYTTNSFSLSGSFSSAGSVSASFSYGALHVLTIDNQEYVYIFGGGNNNIQRAKTSSLTSFTTLSTKLPAAYFGGASFRTESFVYLISGSGTKSMYRASVTNPTSWTYIGLFPVTCVLPGVFTYNRKVYLVGGSDSYLGGSSFNSIYVASFDALDSMTSASTGVWSLSSSKLPNTASSATYFMSNSYAYMTSGNLGTKILRAPLSSLTSWSSISTVTPYSANLVTSFTSGNSLLYYAGLLYTSKFWGLITTVSSRSDMYIAQIEEFKGCYSVSFNDSSVCTGRGRCIERDLCSCFDGFYGDACQFERVCYGLKAGNASVCSGNGVCYANDTCVCQDGASGFDCGNFTCSDILSTDSNACSGNGVCSGPDKCQCKTGYSGQNCEVFSCFGLSPSDSNVCSGLGPCISFNNCSCPADLVEDCSSFGCGGIAATNPKVCNGNGICDTIDHCICNETYGGQFCNVFSCYNISNQDSNVCSGKGSCIKTDMCSCKNGYSGDQCELFTCGGISHLESLVCSGNGSCISPDRCSCNEGWGGATCEIPICFGYLSTDGMTCSAYGTCVSNNTCQCEEGFYGQSCEKFACNGQFNQPIQCSGNGDCSPQTLTCNCKTNYFGDNCEFYFCYGILNNQTNDLCSGHGTCSSVNNCTCESGYFGYSCELHSCNGIPQVTDDYKNLTVNPFANLTQIPCNGKGSCISLDTCVCDSGYYGKYCADFNCSSIHFNDSNSCSGNGTCTKPNKCECKIGFYGDECEKYDCYGYEKSKSSFVCSGVGRCVAPDSCLCPVGYYGQDCSLFECSGLLFNDSNSCSGNGNCTKPGQCQCKEGFLGINCEQYYCHGIVNNQSQVCSGHGNCSSLNNCSCSEGYFGVTCQDYTCGNVLKNQSTVCSGKGSCVAPENCNCVSGYFGKTCELFECYGKLFNNTNVCSGRGSCQVPNNCTCQSNFYGKSCEIFDCYGIPFNASNVCSKNGQCISPNLCECKEDFYGNTCEKFKCFGLNMTDSNVCNTKGQCIGKDGCNCESGYFGKNCSQIGCYGIVATNSSVCSNGNGKCISPNQCECSTSKNGFYYGSTCQFFANNTKVSFTIEIDENRKELLSREGEERLVNVKLNSSLRNVTFLVWCNNCTNYTSNGFGDAMLFNSSDIVLDVSDLPVGGTFEFSLISQNLADKTQFSNIRKLIVAITYRPIDPSEVFIENLDVSNFPKAIVYSSSMKFDFILSKLTFNYFEGIQFLLSDCISTTDTSCQLKYSFNVSIFDSSNKLLSSTIKGKGSAFTPLTNNTLTTKTLKLLPAVNLQFNIPGNNFSTSSLKIQVSISIESETHSFQTFNSSLITESAEGIKPPSTYQVQISPEKVSAIVENITVVSPVWSSGNENFNPIRYAFGFYVTSKKSFVRLTEYSINPSGSFPLPYLSKQKSESMQIDVVIFAVDAQGNSQSIKVGQVAVIPFQGILPSSMSELEKTVLAYDQYTLTNSADSSVIASVINSISVNPADPESSLQVLDSLTSDSSLLSNPSVANQVADTVTSFLTSALELYQNELNTNGFVSSKMSNEAKASAVSVISNLFSSVDTNSTSSSGADVGKKTEAMILSFSKLILTSESPKVLESSGSSGSLSLPVLQFNTAAMNLTFSSFILSGSSSSSSAKRSSKNQDTYQLSSGDSNIQLNLNEIVDKYGGHSKPLGLSLVTFEKNTKVDNFSLSNPISSIVNELKYYQNSAIVKLDDLTTPISLQFGINSASLLLLSKGATVVSQENLNQTQNVTTVQEPYVSCMYWDENENGWRDYGCVLVSFDNVTGKAECACTHTTKFSTFVQYKKRNVTSSGYESIAAIQERTFETVLNSFEIVAGVFFAFASLIILIFLVVFRKYQPIQSRMFTPYIGMSALFIESILISIVQKGLLLDENVNPSSSDSLITGANITGNVTMIIVNTLNITAIFSYLVQVIRFQFMKSLYEKIKRTKTEPSREVVRFLKFITSKLIFFISVFVCACVNLLLWTIFVASVNSKAISSDDYTKGSAICYTVLLIGCSILITITIIVDIFTTVARDDDKQIAERARSRIFSPEEMKHVREGIEEVQSVASPRSFESPPPSYPSFELRSLFRKFLHKDEPLYFRMEMLFFLTSFVFCIIQLITGLVLDQIKSADSTSSTVRALSVIQFIFEVLYCLTYLFVFGGFSLLVVMKHKSKRAKRKANEADSLFEDSEVLELFQDVQGFEIFEEFAQKEFSVENIYLYSELLSNKQMISGNALSKLPNFLDVLSEKFIKNGSTYEVNIPSSTKTEFNELRKTLKEKNPVSNSQEKPETAQVVDILQFDDDHSDPRSSQSEDGATGKIDEQNQLKAQVLSFFDSLSRQVAVNLSDTFSRFANTKIYKSYRKNRDIIQNMVKQANVGAFNNPNVV